MLLLDHISKTFSPGTVHEKAALRDVSFRAAPGEFVIILGANGAGKSTLFGAISGAFPVDSGRILVDGRDVTAMPDYKRSKFLGHLFQDPLRGTAPGMTVGENLALAYMRSSEGTHPFSFITRRRREAFRERLADLDMGLEDRMDTPVGLLSGGQRQALTLLMATMVPPKVLLLDEHTAALDPAAGEKVLALTKRIAAENRLTCLMITHNMASALALGSRTILMAGGQIVLDLSGEARKNMTVDDLLAIFRSRDLTTDRILLSSLTQKPS